MPKSLVAITGASSGIGAVFAHRLAPEHDLLLIARRKERLEEIAADLRNKTTSQIEIAVADLTNESDLSAVAERIRNAENLVLLINNAGFGIRGYFWETSLPAHESMHTLHVMATVRLTHAALSNMVPRDVGGVINVASVAAFIRRAGTASYSATKSWMTAFTEAVHLDLQSAASGVVIQALCPGYTYTEFHDTAGIDRETTAPRSWWHSAEEIVEASLDGLRRKKLFVIPGWRYRALVAIVTKLPGTLRVRFEQRAAKTPKPAAALTGEQPKQLR